MKKIFSFIVVGMIALSSRAQEKEFYVDLNPITMHAEGASGNSPFGLALGFNYYYDLNSQKTLKLGVGGKIAYSWYSDEIQSMDESLKYWRLSVPVSIGYRLQAGELGIMPYCGIDFSYIFSARYTLDGDSYNLFDDDEVSDLLVAKPLQIGLHGGIDFDFRNFVLGLAYQSDLTKFQDNHIELYQGINVVNYKCVTYFSEIEIKLGYRF